MEFFTKTESGSFLGENLIPVLKAALNRRRVRREAEKNRDELLKLGQHLLQDLGFDAKGGRLNPDGRGKIDKSR